MTTLKISVSNANPDMGTTITINGCPEDEIPSLLDAICDFVQQ